MSGSHGKASQQQPTKVDVSSTHAGVPLYPNWVLRRETEPTGHDAPRHYRAPKEDAGKDLTLEEELDVASVVDPLRLSRAGLPALPYAEFHPWGRRAEDTTTLQQDASHNSTLRLGSGGHSSQDVARHGPREQTPEPGIGILNHTHRPTRTHPG